MNVGSNAAGELLHFFSYVTGVSLELPVGWEFVGEDDSSATYAVLDDDGAMTDSSPRVQVRVVGRLEQQQDGHDVVHALADGFAAVEGELVERRDREIDDEPACTVVLRRAGDPETYLHSTAAAAGQALIAVVAAAPTTELLPTIDAAVDSIRFVAL